MCFVVETLDDWVDYNVYISHTAKHYALVQHFIKSVFQDRVCPVTSSRNIKRIKYPGIGSDWFYDTDTKSVYYAVSTLNV